MRPPLLLVPVPEVPLIRPGDDLAALAAAAMARAGLGLDPGDLICVAQKIVSKAEGRQVDLAEVVPGAGAKRLAAVVEKDPRLVQLILDESTEVLRQRPGIVIVQHRLGFVCANAGIDQSNIDHGGGQQALLLPENPDRSAAELRNRLHDLTGVRVGVIITDSHNRPWRLGTLGVAIGSAGLHVLADHRGGEDLFGRELKVTLVNRADAIAAAATLLMGETTEATPIVVMKGLPPQNSEDRASRIVRPLSEDLFR